MKISPNQFLNNFCKCGLFAALCLSITAKSQDITSPRFLKLNIQKLSAPTRLISSEGAPSRAGDSESNYLVDAQLRYPIKLKGRTKFIGAIDYDREVVFGLYTANDNEGEDFNFQNIASSLIAIHQIDDIWTNFTRIKIQNGAEKILPLNRRALNTNFSNFLQKKINGGLIGFGFQIGYNRTFSLLPVFQYEKEFGNGWELNISLPQRILINKQLGKSSRVYAGLKGSRSNYLFMDELQGISSNLYYRRITANAVIGVEKQLSNLFGMMIEAGATKPLRSAVYSFDTGWRKLHDFNEGVAPYVKLGVFLSINKSHL